MFVLEESKESKDAVPWRHPVSICGVVRDRLFWDTDHSYSAEPCASRLPTGNVCEATVAMDGVSGFAMSERRNRMFRSERFPVGSRRRWDATDIGGVVPIG